MSLFAPRRGLPWWAAVLLALTVTALGVFADLERINRLGLVFQAAYFAGCVGAVAWVQRRGLFGPMVQPPLILGVAVPGVVLVSSGAPSGGELTAKALAVATPLINGFPTMAITTGAALLIGLLRLAVQKPPKDAPRRTARDEPPAARDRAQRATRTPGTAGGSTAAKSGTRTGAGSTPTSTGRASGSQPAEQTPPSPRPRHQRRD